MNARTKTAFGIDICTNTVSFVQLEKKGRQIRFLRSATAPLADGIVRDGVIQDPAALVAAIRTFKIFGPLKHISTALTLCAEPVLLQILTLPESTPGEVKKIIMDEVRQYAILPLKNIEIDYCSLKSADAKTKRVLVGAAQSEHLNIAVRTIEKHHINVKTIAPAITAFLNLCFNKIIRPAGEKNVMLLLIRDENLTLCLFRKQRLEFLRTKKFDSDIAGSPQRSNWLGRDIESVIQFYELDDPHGANARPWQVIVAAGCDNRSSLEIVGDIKKDISRQNVEISAFDNNMMDIEIGENCRTPISPVAAGAAMKLLDVDSSGIILDLMPKEIASIKKARKEMLVIANAAACLLLLLFAYVAFLSQKSAIVSRDIYAKKQKQIEMNIQQAIESRKDINGKLSDMEKNLSAVNKAAADRSYHNWAKLLAELVKNVPQTVLIQNLQGRGENVMEIDGLAINYDAVNSFVGLLSRNKLFSEATLADAGQDMEHGSGLVNYKIVCSLAK